MGIHSQARPTIASLLVLTWFYNLPRYKSDIYNQHYEAVTYISSLTSECDQLIVQGNFNLKYCSSLMMMALDCFHHVQILGLVIFYILLYPPQRGYICFVNTLVTPRNNDLGHYVPWRHLISAKF